MEVNLDKIKALEPVENRERYRTVVQFKLDGTPMTQHKSCAAACAALGKPKTSSWVIGDAAKGKRNQAYGFQWRYADQLTEEE